MQCWALAGDGVRAWTTGHWLSSWAHQGTRSTSTDASVRKNYWFLLLETKDVGSLGHQTMPCLRIQFYPTYVRFWLSQSSHIRMHIVLYNAHFSHQKKGNRHIGLGGHQRMVCIWLRSSCFRIRQGLLDLEAVGWDTQAEKCALLFKLKQRDLPQGSSVKR